MYEYEKIFANKQQLQDLSYLEKIAMVQRLYDYAEYIEDMSFVDQDTTQENTNYVSRSTFKNLISK